jgi:uncharacterized protein
MALEVRRYNAVDAFLTAAGEYLARREAEHNLIFGICANVRAYPQLFGDDPPAFAVVADGERVALATLRTPPFNQVLSAAEDPAAVDLLVDDLHDADERLPGVTGPTEVAHRFARRWEALTGLAAHIDLRERIFRLERVVAPRPVSGSWRLAEPRDRQTLIRWLLAFSAEALPNQPQLDDPGGAVDRWIAGELRTMYLWEDGGEVVSMVGAGGPTPNGIRIGPVYTPPPFRGRGYASNLTAAASQAQLDAGRRLCFLFTDLANPTSNRIYRQIGYEPVADVDLWRFAERH